LVGATGGQHHQGFVGSAIKHLNALGMHLGQQMGEKYFAGHGASGYFYRLTIC
jgi:hypothetical protein